MTQKKSNNTWEVCSFAIEEDIILLRAFTTSYAIACVFVFPSFPLRMDPVCNLEGKNESWFYPLPLRNLYRQLEREMPVSLCNCRSDRNAVLAVDHLEIPALISRCEMRRNWVAAFKMVCPVFFFLLHHLTDYVLKLMSFSVDVDHSIFLWLQK